MEINIFDIGFGKLFSIGVGTINLSIKVLKKEGAIISYRRAAFEWIGMVEIVYKIKPMLNTA